MHISPLTDRDYPEADVREYFDVKTSGPVVVIGYNCRPQMAFDAGNSSDLKNMDVFEITGPDFVEELAEYLSKPSRLSKVEIDDPKQIWDFLILSKEGEDRCVGWEFGWVYVTELYENNTIEGIKEKFNVSVQPLEEEILEEDIDQDFDDDEPEEKIPFEELDTETQRALFKAAFIEEFKNGELGIGDYIEDRAYAFIPPEDDGSQVQQVIDFES